MRLYIVRHAVAVPHGTPGVPEDDRPLTPEGIRKMEKAARGLRALEALPEVILTSPLPRASETAAILRKALGGDVPVLKTPTLAPSADRPDFYAELRRHRKLESVMIVGHQPSLGEIASEIAWGSADHALELKKGGACVIEIESFVPAPRGTLLWLLTPAVLRQLA